MNYNIELIRLIAVILITFTHTKQDFKDGIGVFILEDLPRIGTILLSVVSGYLYWETVKKNRFSIRKKFKTLLVPYLIANLSVLLLVCVAYFGFGFNFLNRFSFDSNILTEGIFALNSAPINPPTYFIRDIFMIFVVIELVQHKNLYMLLIILPVLYFGRLFLRYDIVLLFSAGLLISMFIDFFLRNKNQILLFMLVVSLVLIWFTTLDTYRYAVALFVFLLVFRQNIRFYNVGAFSYLLHLYHAPIIILVVSVISKFVQNMVLSVLLQVLLSVFVAYILYLLTRKLPKLRIICGEK